MSKKISVGGIYELVDGRICTIKYIGETHFAGGEWIGVELDPSSGPGKNDGEIGSKRYFKTPKNPPRGLFVRRSKIGGEVTGKRRKAGPRQTGKIKSPDWKPAKFETAAEKGAFLQKYIPASGANVEIRDSHDSSVILKDGRRKKLGPRDIDYSHKGWKPAKYETSDTGKFLEKRGIESSGYTDVRQKSDTQHRIVDGKLKKLGPREIGRMKTPHWKPAKYVDLKEQSKNGGFLDKKLSDRAGKTYTETRDQHDASITVVDGKIKKLGPREIGRMKTPHWKPAKFETDTGGGFLEKRFSSGPKANVEVREASDTQHMVVDGKKKKLGPREIGRMKTPNWKPATYVDLKAKDGGFLDPKFSGKTANLADRRDSHDASVEIIDGKIKKLGPRQIGRMKDTPDWKPAKYDVDTSGSFLDKKFAKNKTFSEAEKREQVDTNFVMKGDKLRKAGPRDIGKVDNPNWKPAKFETNDGVVSNPVQSGGLEPGFEIRDGKRRALGPRDIGQTEESNWKPANYDRHPAPVSNDLDDPVEEDDEQHYDTNEVDEHQEEVYEEDHVYAEGDVVVEAGSAPEDAQGDEYVHEDKDHNSAQGDEYVQEDKDEVQEVESGDKASEDVEKALESETVEEVVAEQAEPL